MSRDNDNLRPVPILDYDSDFACKKCDGKKEEEPGVKVTWCSGGVRHVNGNRVELPEDFEFMHCKCCTCGYEWLSQTSDADDRATAEKEAYEEEMKRKEETKKEKEAKAGRMVKVK